MVFNKEIGKMFNRKKPTPTSQERKDSENVVVSPDLKGLEVSSVEAQAPLEKLVVLDSYSLNGSFASVQLTRDAVRGNIVYTVKEPALNVIDVANLQRLKKILTEVLELKATELESKKAAEEYLIKKCNEVLDDYRFKLDSDTKSKLLYYVTRDNLGLGKIDSLMHDPLIEDISCDGVNVPMYIWHRKFESVPTNIRF